MVAITCEHCRHPLSVEVDGKVKLRVKIISFGQDGAARTPCPRCRADTRVPVQLDAAHRPAPVAPRGPRGRLVLTLPRAASV